ncbi:ParB/Srx family N-terminal domain-containing protein [Pseudomonas sp. P5_152]|uniref:ParB/RepB/Spo0J family partition protein n=1 Tax=Pseudomonas sp. P5_152 TaxID=3043442 RepID=UPI002A35ADF0|nr:ParB/Srx family N-terminal domain-containing protein [Pseudomonas sp. P5_152]MDX9668628.1 ParB/Srx family N-terminal domain-containing protein [Pseudomonas sp. P5_152]
MNGLDHQKHVDEGEWRLIPLNKLRRAAGNVRKVKANLHQLRDVDSALTPMQHSIMAQGLLQNLIVVEAIDGGFDVWGGGERLANLNDLLAKEMIKEDHKVMCRVMAEELARIASLSENTHRSPMHPADEFDAMSLMVNDEGRSVEDVAAIFGFTPGVIKRRLRLASLSPKVMTEFREGRADLEQMMALTLASDHCVQEDIYFNLPEGRRWASSLRELATRGEINLRQSNLAAFVTLETYEAAGGVSRQDMFDDKNIFLEDALLVQKLATEKLEGAAEQVRAEGWSWVEVVQECKYETLQPFSRIYPVRRELTAGETSAAAALDAEIIAMETRLLELEETDDSAEAESVRECLEQIEEAREAIDFEATEFLTEHYSTAGAIVTIQRGKLEIIRGLQKGTGRGKVETAGAEAPAKLSERMARQLTAHKTAALQVAIASDPKLALASTLHRLVMSVFHNQRWYAGALPVNVSIEQTPNLEEYATDVGNSSACKNFEKLVSPWRKRLPNDPAKLFTVLLKLSMTDLNQLLAVCVALSTNVIASRATDGTTGSDALARTCKLDMSKSWVATAESYFSQVPKRLVLEAVKEFAPDQVERLSNLRKGEISIEAEKLAKGKDWLPLILHTNSAK